MTRHDNSDVTSSSRSRTGKVKKFLITFLPLETLKSKWKSAKMYMDTLLLNVILALLFIWNCHYSHDMKYHFIAGNFFNPFL
ncbi:hypothetical protein POVCU2_0045270 [Plasmodium ovale curtisi]|uniref:Uncharacterized protein n=1 Tax=Plasmodium ovale curtisi TaxID=864141 RepID=A0A1A8W7F6_PLAOA|nr:hypothetical protein POVCU2_0045270 [Plasmodium ovale curtisi]SBS99533.1 hypothetical protein POVCU1_053360 [Plasmodium ovale curtisi]